MQGVFLIQVLGDLTTVCMLTFGLCTIPIPIITLEGEEYSRLVVAREMYVPPHLPPLRLAAGSAETGSLGPGNTRKALA